MTIILLALTIFSIIGNVILYKQKVETIKLCFDHIQNAQHDVESLGNEVERLKNKQEYINKYRRYNV